MFLIDPIGTTVLKFVVALDVPEIVAIIVGSLQYSNTIVLVVLFPERSKAVAEILY